MDADERLRITDFGLASSPDGSGGCTAEFAGTLLYMAPEPVRGEGSAIDGRTDVWALGAELYEMLRGGSLVPDLEAEFPLAEIGEQWLR